MYFGMDQLAQLTREHSRIAARFAALQRRYVGRNFSSEAAKEYAIHGFCRRLAILVRCIDRVFEALPPGREDIPERDEVIDATIHIQAFVLNVFGCCDNLAWIWVNEKNLMQKDGVPLEPKRVGLGKAYKHVRQSFSPDFASYLDSRQDWLEHIKDFRDALAHRIPLYIPPYCIGPRELQEYELLEAAANEAIRGGDCAGYDQLMEQQKQIAKFKPIMTHSLFQNAETVVFHPQMLADFSTIDEIGNKLLAELDR